MGPARARRRASTARRVRPCPRWELVRTVGPSRRPPDGERHVVPAETEGIGERYVHVPLHGLVGRRVEVASRIGRELVNGGRDDSRLDDEGADACLECAGRAQQVAGHRLGGAEDELTGAVAEHGLHGGGLGGVAETAAEGRDRKSTRLNSSHVRISYAVFCLKKKKNIRSNYPTLLSRSRPRSRLRRSARQ